ELPRPGRPDEDRVQGRGDDDGLVPRVSPRPGDAAQAAQRGFQHGLQVPVVARGPAGHRRTAHRGLPHRHRQAHPMLDVPPMNEGGEDRRDFARLREKLASQQGPAYWRSLGELAETEEFKEFLEKEFPRQAAPLEGGLDRRDFLKLLGASLALAGLSACARPPLPEEKIVPYVRAPAEVTPGKPLFYATAVTYGGFAEGVLAESHQGRP